MARLRAGPRLTGLGASPAVSECWAHSPAKDLAFSEGSELFFFPFVPSRCDAAQGARQGQAACSSPERHDSEGHRRKNVEAGQPDRPGRVWPDLLR